MVQRLSIKDTIQQWVSKINSAIDLNTVDGTFGITDSDGLTVTFSGGYVRVGNGIIDVPSTIITLTSSEVVRVGPNTDTSIIEAHLVGAEPSAFLPMWEIQTGVNTIASTTDLRTFVQA